MNALAEQKKAKSLLQVEILNGVSNESVLVKKTARLGKKRKHIWIHSKE